MHLQSFEAQPHVRYVTFLSWLGQSRSILIPTNFLGYLYGDSYDFYTLLVYYPKIPKCCESGQLTTEVCSGCPTCAAAKDQECGAGFEAFQPDCGKGLSCFTRCGNIKKYCKYTRTSLLQLLMNGS